MMDSSLDQKNFKFLKSNNLKGRPVIEDTNGYQYRFRRECTGANVYYKCRAVDKFKCPATGILRPNLGTFEPRSVHNHPVESARLAVENVISANIENAAKNPEIQPRNVMANSSNNIWSNNISDPEHYVEVTLHREFRRISIDIDIFVEHKQKLI